MIDGLKPYAEYKESGLPWLDTVPKHWDMAPNRALMRDQRQVVGARASDYTLLSLTLRGVIARDMVNPKGKFPAQFNTYKVVKPDDFVFCLFDIDETPRGVGLSPLKGMITGAYDIFSPTHRINPRFLYHYYLFVDEGKLMKPLYTGLRKTIQRGVFASLKAPLPPPEEQTAIVRFLDHANRKIDGFIRAKRKLIGLLNEQKQAIIHRAVTRGLQPDVPLKPSGIPWLGDIPKHWEVKRLRHACEMRVSNVDKHTKHGETPVRLCNYVEVYKNERISESTRFMAATANQDERVRFGLRKGDVLITKDSEEWNDIGVPALVEYEAPDLVCGYHLAILRPRPGLLGSFLHRALDSRFIATQFHVEANGVTRYGLSQGAILGVSIPIPPPIEQQNIVNYLDAQLAGRNTAIARTEREIALMQEYRTRLTADVLDETEDLEETPSED